MLRRLLLTLVLALALPGPAWAMFPQVEGHDLQCDATLHDWLDAECWPVP